MTPDQASPEQAIAGILDSLRRAREFLLDPSPQNIDCCGMMLGQCANRMAGLLGNPELTSGTENSMALVRTELNAIAGLLASAATFRRDLLKVMRAAASPLAIPGDTTSQKAQRVHVLC
ncbi:MAG TPA: hypothetical protein VK789_18150 [Bryobacteraceae bacterium]|jgi:hypothetical protein|nr:hypothetical protein [Bryobacteraceae bacterium]